MRLPYPCILLHHRLPAICCALLCTGAMILCISSASTCQFLRIKYDNTPHSPFENFDNVPIIDTSLVDPRYHHNHHNHHNHQQQQQHQQQQTYRSKDDNDNGNTNDNDNDNRNTYSETHDIGLFCNSVQYDQDVMWNVSRGFTYASLAIVTICTVVSWMITSLFKPSSFSWKLLSILSLSAAGVETPIFLFFTSKTCQPHSGQGQGQGQQQQLQSGQGQMMNDGECVAGEGFFMLLWSILLLISVTAITQVFNYPEYVDVLDEWRVKKSRHTKDSTIHGRGEMRHFISIMDYLKTQNNHSSGNSHHGQRHAKLQSFEQQQQQQHQQKQQHQQLGNQDFLVQQLNDFEDDSYDYNDFEDGLSRKHLIQQQEDTCSHDDKRKKKRGLGLRHNGRENDDDKDENVDDPLCDLDQKDDKEERIDEQKSWSLIKSGYMAVKNMVFGNPQLKHEVFQEHLDDNDDIDIDMDNNDKGVFNHSPNSFDEEVGRQNPTSQSGSNNHNNNQHHTTYHNDPPHHTRKKETLIDIHHLDTKSDSSRLLIRVGANGRKVGDDQESIHSFDLNLDDYSITSLGSDSKDISQRPCQNVSPNTNPKSANATGHELEHEYEHHGNDNDDVNAGERSITYPVQFYPSSKAAASSDKSLCIEPKPQTNSTRKQPFSFPTQQLRQNHITSHDNHSDDKSSTNSYNSDNDMNVNKKVKARTLLDRSTNKIGRMDEKVQANRVLVDVVASAKTNNKIEHWDETASSNDCHPSSQNRVHLISPCMQLMNEQDQSESKPQHEPFTPVGGEENKNIVLDLSFYKAIVAGTNAAENSNNSQEDEPEPIYHSSSESETSSISCCSSDESYDDSRSDLSEENNVSYYSEESGSGGGDCDLEETSKYLSKKLRSLRRRAERKKESSNRKKARAEARIRCRSVCSHVSLTELTINEETDLDLKLEDYSGDDHSKDYHSHTEYNIVSPSSLMDGYSSVKSSPASIGISATTKEKIKPYFSRTPLTVLSPSSPSLIDDDDDKNYSDDNNFNINVKKRRSVSLPPIVSPINHKEYNYEDNDEVSSINHSVSSKGSGSDCSLSTNARKNRMNRIRFEMKKVRRSRLKTKLSDKLTVNDSYSYGSDEASV